jgi:hypothetical protein
MTPFARLAAAAARIVAGPQETRVVLYDDVAEAYRAGWIWREGLQALIRLRQEAAPDAALMAWEGGACAFDPGDPESPALAPAPAIQGRPHCPGLGLLPNLLEQGGPALAELPDGQLLLLPPVEDASAHARLSWTRCFPHFSSSGHRFPHPFLTRGIVLRRTGPLVGAFAVRDAWPLALRRLDL